MRKNLFPRLIVYWTAVFMAVSGAFAALLFRFHPKLPVLIGSFVYMLCAGTVCVGFMLSVRREMGTVLGKLSEMLEGIIHRRDMEIFSSTEDTLLSKLQSQVMQLTGILSVRQERYLRENREIKSLISDISHQLKTPVANLAMYGSLLDDPELPDDKRLEFTGRLRSQISKLAWLMDSLIKLSRLESGIIAIRAEAKDLGNTVLSAIRQAYPAAVTKNVTIDWRGGRGIILSHDAKWTAEAVYNVIDNAIKYTEQGGRITVSLNTYDLFARMDIADNGRGIPREEINEIFKRFYRGSNVGESEGVGLGLYLTRTMIATQGGYIKAASEPGGGSVFSIFLPLGRSPRNFDLT